MITHRDIDLSGKGFGGGVFRVEAKDSGMEPNGFFADSLDWSLSFVEQTIEEGLTQHKKHYEAELEWYWQARSQAQEWQVKQEKWLVTYMDLQQFLLAHKVLEQAESLREPLVILDDFYQYMLIRYKEGTDEAPEVDTVLFRYFFHYGAALIYTGLRGLEIDQEIAAFVDYVLESSQLSAADVEPKKKEVFSYLGLDKVGKLLFLEPFREANRIAKLDASFVDGADKNTPTV